MNLRNYLTVEESTKYVGVTRTTIYNWMQKGILPYHKKGSLRLINKRTLQAVDVDQAQNPYGIRGARGQMQKKS